MKLRLLLGLFCAALANGAVRLPALLSDHMMLQRGMPVRIWGWADAGEAVNITFQYQKVSTVADGTGKWQVFLNPLEVSGPSDLTVAGTNTITVHDVLVAKCGLPQASQTWSRHGQGRPFGAGDCRRRLSQATLFPGEEGGLRCSTG